MIHFHGGPITPEYIAAHVWRNRHAMISFAHTDQLPVIREVCASFAVDNGAFSAWRKTGEAKRDWSDYYDWISGVRMAPNFAWSIIPDIIDGSEADNDALLCECHGLHWVPVYHLHESLERFTRLVESYPVVALGSSGIYADPGAPQWWDRMASMMDIVCDCDGLPAVKLHGLRMMSSRITQYVPFASVDSTNVARNIGLDVAWKTSGITNKKTRADVILSRIEGTAYCRRYNFEALPYHKTADLFEGELA